MLRDDRVHLVDEVEPQKREMCVAVSLAAKTEIAIQAERALVGPVRLSEGRQRCMPVIRLGLAIQNRHDPHEVFEAVTAVMAPANVQP